MRRIGKILSFICLGFVILGVGSGLSRLPADPGKYVEKKYAGWNGVLRCWVYSDWSCSGSFISWLNGCAAEFEARHPGVYLEFETVTEQALGMTGIRPPDMLVYSEGACAVEAEAIARGGYIFVENPDASGTAIPAEYCAALIAMYEDAQIEIPEEEMDLGLPVSAVLSPIEIDGDAFQRFMNGETGRTIVNQAQLGQMMALRDSGRGPDWSCAVQGKYNWCDQRLMLGILQREEEPGKLCADFLSLLLEEAQQAALSQIGAFPVTGVRAYDGRSDYRFMEQQILGSRAIFEKSEHSVRTAEALVRKLNAGEILPGDAAEFLAETNS